MASTLRRIDMTTGPILPQIIRFSVPVAGASILQILFNAADTIVVGRFAGSTCMGAVGATGSIVSTLVLASSGIANGANILIARRLGAKQEDQVSAVVHNSILLGLLIGLFACALGYAILEPALVLLDTPEELFPLSVKYLKIYFIGVPATLLYNFGAAVMRANGDTRRPMLYLTISGIINVIMNVITVVFLHMDVDGVAIATVISQYISLVLLLRCLMRIEGCCKLEPRKLRPNVRLMFKVFRTGVPDCIQSILFGLANLSLTKATNSFGAGLVAANTAVNNIDSMVNAFLQASVTTSVTFTSQNYGAKNFPRIRRVFILNLVYFVSIGIVVGSLATIFGRSLLSIYVKPTDPNFDLVIREGLLKMRYMILWEWLSAILLVCSGAVRGLGKNWQPMIVTLLGCCIFRIVWLEVLLPMNPTTVMLYLLYPASWIITSAAHFVCFVFAFRKLKKAQESESLPTV